MMRWPGSARRCCTPQAACWRRSSEIIKRVHRLGASQSLLPGRGRQESQPHRTLFALFYTLPPDGNSSARDQKSGAALPWTFQILTGISPTSLTSITKTGSLKQTQHSLTQPTLLISLLWGSPVSAFQGWNYSRVVTPYHYMGSGNPDYGPHPCESALSTPQTHKQDFD